MTIAQFIVAYSVCWWLVLFMVLPSGAAPVQNPTPGHAPSAPANPRLKRKCAITSLIAILPTLLIYFIATTAKADDGIYHVGSGCTALETYIPADDLSTRDGYGTGDKKVTPADLESSTILGDMSTVDIPLEIPSAKYLDTSKYNADMSESRINLGKLQVGSDGKSLLNGQPISAQASYPKDCGGKHEK